LEPTVYYTSLYGLNAGYPTDRRLFHEVDGFLTPVNKEWAYIGPRFNLVAPLNKADMYTLLIEANVRQLSQIKNEKEFEGCVEKILLSR
jgi:hypothetical protein